MSYLAIMAESQSRRQHREYPVCLTWLPSRLFVALYDSPELEPGSGVGVPVPFVAHVYEGRTVGAHL